MMIRLIVLVLGLSATVTAAQAQQNYRRMNRIVFAIADSSIIAGAVSTMSAQGERGRRNLGYLLILGGAATIAIEQSIGYSIYGYNNWGVAINNFKRDCRIHDEYPDLEVATGLTSLSQGIDLYSGQSDDQKIKSTCSLYARVTAKVKQMNAKTAVYTDALANEAGLTASLSENDARIIKNMFGANGVL